MRSSTKSLSPFQYHLRIGLSPEEHTFEIADELVDRLKYNTKPVVTTASRKTIKYGVEMFTLTKHPHQILYCLDRLNECGYWNVAINEMIIHLRYLWSWRYFFKLIGKHQHHFSDLYKLAISGNLDILEAFDDIKNIHTHKDFIDFMWKIRATLDFDEMLALNNCASFWKKHTETYRQHLNNLFWGRLTPGKSIIEERSK